MVTETAPARASGGVALRAVRSVDQESGIITFASLRMLELSGVFMAVTFAVFATYGVFAAAVRDHMISRPRVMAWMRRSFAAAFRRACRTARPHRALRRPGELTAPLPSGTRASGFT